MSDISTTVPPTNVDGLAWKRQFVGDDTRPDWEWRHFDLVHAQARVTIEDDAEFPVFAKALMNGTDESPRVVSDGNVVAGVLPSYARTGDVDQFELTYWHFAMLPHALITGRQRPSRTLANMWEAVAGGLNPTGPANLVDRCLAALNDRTRSLQDELTTRLAEEANRRLYIVSVVTTVLLPATFVTGFFGMNTGGMLWSGDEVPQGTVFATALCAAAVVVTLLWLRWKRML
jgi:hypothetical protein